MSPEDYAAYLERCVEPDLFLEIIKEDELITVSLRTDDAILFQTECDTYRHMTEVVNQHLNDHPDLPIEMAKMNGYIFQVRTSEQTSRFIPGTKVRCPFKRRQEYNEHTVGTVSFMGIGDD
jgi:hypothetical protein